MKSFGGGDGKPSEGFFNINGPASPSGPTIFPNGALPLRCVRFAVAGGLPLICNKFAPGGGCGLEIGFWFHVPSPLIHGEVVRYSVPKS